MEAGEYEDAQAVEAPQNRKVMLSRAETKTGAESRRETEGEPVPFWQRKIFTVPVKNAWPAPVASKMNLAEWAELMRETGLEKDIPYIIDGFKNSFCLVIPQHELEGMRWYTPENHKSAVVVRQQIELTLEKEKKAGRMAGPFTHEVVHKHLGFF